MSTDIKAFENSTSNSALDTFTDITPTITTSTSTPPSTSSSSLSLSSSLSSIDLSCYVLPILIVGFLALMLYLIYLHVWNNDCGCQKNKKVMSMKQETRAKEDFSNQDESETSIRLPGGNSHANHISSPMIGGKELKDLLDKQSKGMMTKPIVVGFFSKRCGHCTSIKPAYEEATKRVNSEGKAVMYSLYCDDDVDAIELARSLKIEGFPTILLFKQGKRVGNEFEGERNSDNLYKFAHSGN